MCSKKDRLDGGKVQQISPFLFVFLYVSQFVLSNKKVQQKGQKNGCKNSTKMVHLVDNLKKKKNVNVA